MPELIVHCTGAELTDRLPQLIQHVWQAGTVVEDFHTLTRAAFERAASEFVQAVSEWGLTVSIEKTKGMIIGRQLTASDSMPVELDSGSIDIVQDLRTSEATSQAMASIE